MTDTDALKELLGKATPGPWDAVPTTDGDWSICDPGGSVIAKLPDHANEFAVEDAQLVALAPALAREVIALRAEIARLTEALQPFADEAGNYDYGDGPDYEYAPDESSLLEITDLLVSNLRRARAALTPTTGDKDKGI